MLSLERVISHTVTGESFPVSAFHPSQCQCQPALSGDGRENLPSGLEGRASDREVEKNMFFVLTERISPSHLPSLTYRFYSTWSLFVDIAVL